MLCTNDINSSLYFSSCPSRIKSVVREHYKPAVLFQTSRCERRHTTSTNCLMKSVIGPSSTIIDDQICDLSKQHNHWWPNLCLVHAVQSLITKSVIGPCSTIIDNQICDWSMQHNHWWQNLWLVQAAQSLMTKSVIWFKQQAKGTATFLIYSNASLLENIHTLTYTKQDRVEIIYYITHSVLFIIQCTVQQIIMAPIGKKLTKQLLLVTQKSASSLSMFTKFSFFKFSKNIQFLSSPSPICWTDSSIYFYKCIDLMITASYVKQW